MRGDLRIATWACFTLYTKGRYRDETVNLSQRASLYVKQAVSVKLLDVAHTQPNMFDARLELVGSVEPSIKTNISVEHVGTALIQYKVEYVG